MEGLFYLFTLKLGVEFPLKEHKTPSYGLDIAALIQLSPNQEVMLVTDLLPILI